MKGIGEQIDYGKRIYDPRVGRFLSVDPLMARYPWNSPYSFAENDVMRAIDLDGAEHKIVIHWVDKKQGDGTFHIVKTSVRINQNESFDGWGQPSTASKSSGSVFALTETYYYMMSDKKLYKGKDLLENSNVNSVNPPPSAQYDYSPNVMEDKAIDDAKWAGLNPLKWGRLVARDAAAPDNAQTMEDVNAAMTAFSSVVGAPGMLRGMLKAEAIAVNGVNAASVTTPYGEALQSTTAAATQGAENVANGATLYRLGTTGASKTGAEAQFWSLENPLTMTAEAYAKKYGIKLSRVQNADFIETATVKNGAKYITREAPVEQGAPEGAGGGIEAVVEQGGTAGNKITPVNR